MNRQCPECESYVDDSATFCNQCGANLLTRRRSSRASRANIVRTVIVLVLLGVGGVGVIVYFQQERSPSDKGSGGAVHVGNTDREDETDASLPGKRVGLRRARLEADAASEAPRILAPREVRALTRNAIVSLQLFDADGDLFASNPGILIEEDGLVLTRFQSLMGATRGICRARGRQAGLYVSGAVHVDLLRDLALLQLSEVSNAVEIDEALPGLAPLVGDDARDAIEIGLEVFVAGRDKYWRSTTVSDTRYFSLDQVERLRLQDSESTRYDPFVVVDALGFVVGLYATEESTGSEESVDLLVDPVHWVESHLDSEQIETLERLSARYFDGTFAAFLYYGSKLQRLGEHERALDSLFQAIAQGAIERVEDELIDQVTDLLGKSLSELVQRRSREERWDLVVELLERGLDVFPDDAEYWTALAAAYIQLERFEDAIPAALRARELKAGSEADRLVLAAYLRLALALKTEGDLQETSRVLLEGIDSLRDSGRLHFELAKIYHEWDLLEDAVRVFRIARDLDGTLAAEIDVYLDRIDDEIKRREAVIIPIREGAASIAASVVLNGSSRHEFLVDTGATLTAISQQMATDLGYRLGPQLRWVRVRTANGVVEAPIVVLNSVSIEGFTVDNLEAIALPHTSPELGLLGLNFLNHFKYTVDNKRRELRLERR